MKVSRKICLIIAIFLISATGVWAGFNYDSAQNYFLIDSFLKTEGNSIIVGTALNETTNSFAASNNLIFLDSASRFISGTRQINKNIFSTSAINFKTGHNVVIMPIGNVGSLSLEGNIVKMNKNFRVKGGMAFDGRDLSGILNKNLYVDRVVASSLELLTVDQLTITPQTLLTVGVAGGGTITANKIFFDNAPFCKIETWNAKENKDNALANKKPQEKGASADTMLDSDDIDHCTDTSTKTNNSKRTCCKKNFYVFDMDVNAGKMVCCRFASARLSL